MPTLVSVSGRRWVWWMAMVLLAVPVAVGCAGDESQGASRAEPTTIFLTTPEVPTHTTAVGDSVMLAAIDQLEAEGIAVDAEVGRSVPQALEVLRGIAGRGELRDRVLVHIGHNSVFTAEEFDEFVALADGRPITFLTVNVPLEWEAPNNDVLRAGALRHTNVAVVEWKDAVIGRPELFWEDGIHLRPEGAAFYAEFVTGLLQ